MFWLVAFGASGAFRNSLNNAKFWVDKENVSASLLYLSCVIRPLNCSSLFLNKEVKMGDLAWVKKKNPCYALICWNQSDHDVFLCNLTWLAASLMNCLAAGVHIAGTVSTHWISSALNWSSPVSKTRILIASSFRNSIESANTVWALTSFPFAALMDVSLLSF